MNARVFLDAFAGCLVGVAIARVNPRVLRERMRAYAVLNVALAHGHAHAEDTGRMFDRLWNEAHGPEAKP